MIRVEHVTKTFGPQVVLDDVSVEIPDGKTTAIVGPSGVGKSVLIKLIMGIMSPDSGDIFVGDRNMAKARSEAERLEIRSCLGVLFQSAALFDSFTVYQNVEFPLLERCAMPPKLRHEKVVAMIDSLSLHPYAERYPEEISIGVRKRVGLARSLITEPQVLLFDEPNTGLDPHDGQEVYDLIKHCKERWGFTGVVISHELPEVFQVADRVIMLLGGKVIAEGSPDELTASPNPAVQQFLYGRTDGPIKIQ